ncbi:MAG: hypothetical protein Q9225_006467 [Loekoesia sp. 1 TL-2023]
MDTNDEDFGRTFTIRFIVDILFGVEAVVQVVFFLIITIIYQSVYLAEISLLGVLYILLPDCSTHPGRQSNQNRMWKGLRIAHAIFILILVALWLSAMALKIKYQVDSVIGDPWYFRRTIRSFHKIDGAYNILYFVVTIEIFGWSVLGLVDANKRRESRRTQLVLLSLVAGPLLLRSAYSMGDSIYEELQLHRGSRRLNLATDIIYNITSLLIYAGIVAISRQIGKGDQLPPNPNHIDPSYDPNFWGANGNQVHNLDPKNQMTVHQAAPPVYQQYAGYPGPQQHGGYANPMQQTTQGGMQYAPQPPQLQQQQQQNYMQQYQQPQPQPYPNQTHQYQQQQPYQNNNSPQQYQQPYQNPSAPQPQQNQTMTQGGPAPSEVNGSSVSELSSPTNTHAR